jgi:hypothetical protein
MKAGSAAASGARHIAGVSLQALLIFAIVATILLALAPVSKPADLMAGTGRADAAGKVKYSGYAWTDPTSVPAGGQFDVYGCHYDTSLGNVMVGFTGGGWGSPLDANGCFEIENIPALSGDTLAAGVYDINIYQQVRGKWRITGGTTITVTN